MAKKAQEPKSRLIERHDVCEIFTDGISGIQGSTTSLRITFTSKRVRLRGVDGPPAGFDIVPTCLLVLDMSAATELYNKLSQVIAHLEVEGVVQREHTGPETVQ